MSIINIIKEWIGLELYCKDSYNQLASLSDNPHAQSMFKWLSETSGKHAEYLKKAAEILGESLPPEVFRPKEPAGIRQARNLTPVKAVYHGAKGHLKIEEEAIKTYRRLAEQVENLRAKEIFQRLADEEEKHHKELSNLIQTLEKTYLALKSENSP
ncbi:TPA: DUF2383 domain-containing protein [Candidatus Bathyarchaeota archaeon]|nr:DUF2383 domain-containing protein [Candidatus Bathyarchaeota archaeon]